MFEIVLIVILLAVALAMDSFAIAITLGVSGLSKENINRLKIALTFGFFQGGFFLLGYIVLFVLGKNVTKYNSLVAGLLLAFLGTKMLIEAFDKKEKLCVNEECINCKKNRCLKTGEYRFLTFKLLLIYGSATSIDAFAAGVSFGLKYDEIILAVISISFITFIFSYFGSTFGMYLKKYIKNKAEIIGGLILIFLAIKSLI